METLTKSTKTKMIAPQETANNRRFTRIFESKIFPHFSLFSTESTIEVSDCSFISAFKNQISIIKGLIASGKIGSTFIINSHGESILVKPDYYKNTPDHILDALKSHGIEHGLAYQTFRMIYTYRCDVVGGIHDENDGISQERVKITHNFFNLDGFQAKYLNPLARLHYKYAVFLEKEDVKTAIYAKPEETPKQYNVTISIPTPHVMSEIYITERLDDNTLVFNIPDLYTGSVTHLMLPIVFDTREDYVSVRDHFMKGQNVFLSILRINDDNTVTMKFEGLGIVNEFFLNRRAALVESEGGNSLEFYKIKLSEISISTAVREEYSPKRSLQVTQKRVKMEREMKERIDDEDFLVRISRSKQVMHGIKNNRSAS